MERIKKTSGLSSADSYAMTYPGAKSTQGVPQRIIGQMPVHDVYIEPFFGSGQIFWRKKPALKKSIVLDKDNALLANARIAPHTLALDVDSIPWLETANLAWESRGMTAERTVIYCDPPYILSTRANRRYYTHEMTLMDHERLLRILTSLDCNILVSHYPHPLYNELHLLHGWRCQSYRLRTRGKTVTECLWMNFPEPTVLHDWRYAGKSHRERLSLKRLVLRWRARLANMPARKRGYLLSELALAPSGAANGGEK